VIVLADNDLILKLARCDLLKSLPDLLQVPIKEIFIAPAARFQLLPHKPEKALAKCGNPETVERIRDFLSSVKDVPEVADVQLLTRLASVPKIDAGEQLLFASCVANDQALLLTGDRNSLNALSGSKELSDVQGSLFGRVVTFESALLLAAKIFGFDFIKGKLLAYPEYEKDGVLKLIVRENMGEANFEECLVSYSRSVVQFLASREQLPSSLFEAA
jgi:hypothetical protein